MAMRENVVIGKKWKDKIKDKNKRVQGNYLGHISKRRKSKRA